MDRVLTILEVSRKQDYIFAKKRMRENARRSEEIAYATSSAFFRECAGELYDEERNMVYAGGGHTVLQFDGREQAVAFTRAVTETALRRFDGMEIFARTLPYDESRTPGENLTALSAALERKKALRQNSFRRTSFGVEALDGARGHQTRPAEGTERRDIPGSLPKAPAGWSYLTQLEMAGDGFIAVVHIDGNAMGGRVNRLYERCDRDWEDCAASLRRFSEGIQEDFETAFRRTVQLLMASDPAPRPPALPIRPIILAGDDVCFVTDGRLGLECARVFLEQLAALTNREDGRPYAACAGVALVHRKYPFHRAYDLAEELCGSAKKFGASLDREGRVSAMDWHVEFGQLKGGLAAIRGDYEAEDGCRLELRPVTAVVPPEAGSAPAEQRTYDFFRKMCAAMHSESGQAVRKKMKELRAVLKQGETESRFFLRGRRDLQLLYQESAAPWGEAFADIEGEKRCLFFDAIELYEHCGFLEVTE